MITLSGPWFKDEYNRTLILRGVNLGGSTKVPTRPDGATYRKEGFFEHRTVSFVGRPFPLEEADEHFSRLREWGFNFLRFLTTWEAIEHAGPGIYDEAYLEYLRAVVKKAGEYGFNLFIDPHQDVWSRFSGGDGAPGWTFELLGMDITRFKETGAAIVHQTHGDPFPRMIWPTNDDKFAAATLFTLFFGGRDFAPNTMIEGVSAQDFLQDHYIASIRKVAEYVGDLPNVVGYDTLNEPSHGYIGIKDLCNTFGNVRMGVSPSPFQSMLLASGIPQQVVVLEQTIFGVRKRGSVWVNRERTSLWKPGFNCIWRENGVWDLDDKGKPVLLKPDAFSMHNDRPVNFAQDYYLPFAQKFAREIRSVDPEAILFIETEPSQVPPVNQANALENIVYAPHWYDGVTLVQKTFSPFLGYDDQKQKVIFGRKKIREMFRLALQRPKNLSAEKLGNAPVLIGEIGIPYDLDKKKAYRTGDFSQQIKAYDMSFQALETNLLSYTLWNYTSDNTNAHGDLWNDEDLSIFSRDQQKDPSDINSGGRALEAVIRPFPIATAGIPISMKFDLWSGEYLYEYQVDNTITEPTIIYVPHFQYPQGVKVEVSSGEISLDLANQRLVHKPGSESPCWIKLTRK